MDLSEIDVVDLTRHLPGPFATQLLADAGATVVKIERPGTGDPAREMAGSGGPNVFSTVNRGKLSVTLDLTETHDRRAALDLAETADVVIEDFRPGVVDRLGVGPETVTDVNPSIVYCSLSGYSPAGPNRDRAGHDLNYTAMTGIAELTNDRNGTPTIPGVPIADLAGGLYAAAGIMGALLTRELTQTGGEVINISLTEAAAALTATVLPTALTGGNPRGGETALTGRYPCYDLYQTADDRWVAVTALEPRFWEQFCELLDHPELIDHHLATDPDERAAVRSTIAETFERHSQEEWVDRIDDRDVMVTPVLTPQEALTGQEITHSEFLVEGPAGPRLRLPIHSSSGIPGTNERLPELGEHTEQICGFARCDENEPC